MSKVIRHNRKGTDEQIVSRNCLGFSLAAIGSELGCHPTSVTMRLKSLNIPPVDGRRTFMEDVLRNVPSNTLDNLADILMNDPTGKPKGIKTYVRELILKDLAERTYPNQEDKPVVQA